MKPIRNTALLLTTALLTFGNLLTLSSPAPAEQIPSSPKRTAHLTSPAKFPVVIKGKTVGTITLPAGTEAEVLREEGGKFLIKTRTGESWVDANQITFTETTATEPDANANTTEPGPSSDALEPFQITIAGKQVTVDRMGTGPVGVVFFGHSDSRVMKEALLAGAKEFPDLLPNKCSFFLWEYPESAPFDQVQDAISAYLEGDQKKLRPDFSKIASSAVQQIRKKTGLKELLLVGNSLGAGIILWDYKSLAADPKTKFLLISPTEAFMPPVSSIGDFKRTVLLSATEEAGADPFLKGQEASEWVQQNISGDTIEELIASELIKPDAFERDHKIIGQDIQLSLLSKMLAVALSPTKPPTMSSPKPAGKKPDGRESHEGNDYDQLLGRWQKIGGRYYDTVFEFKSQKTLYIIWSYERVGSPRTYTTQMWDVSKKTDKFVIEMKEPKNRRNKSYRRWIEIPIPFNPDSVEVKDYTKDTNSERTEEFQLQRIEADNENTSNKNSSDNTVSNYKQLLGAWKSNSEDSNWSFEFKSANLVQLTRIRSENDGTVKRQSKDTSTWKAKVQSDKIIIEPLKGNRSDGLGDRYEIKIPFNLESLEITLLTKYNDFEESATTIPLQRDK